MTQYLFAVHMVEGEPVPSDEEMQKAFRQVDEFNKEVMDSGAWVFAGGLHPPTSATVVRVQDGEVLTTDGPFAETQGAARRLLGPRGPRSRRGAGAGRQGFGRLHGARRGPALPGRAGGLGGP